MRTGKAERAEFHPPLEGGSKSAKQISGRSLTAALFAFALVAIPAQAGWRDIASQFDQQRLARIDEARAKGLDQAQGAPASDLAAIDSVLHAEVVPASASALEGAWRCRIIKLGGMSPDRLYPWYRCRIRARQGTLFFEKLSGATRTSGFLYGEGQGYVYLGAWYVKGEKPHAYSGNGASAGAAATPDDQIGLLSLLADNRARIELPYPIQESTFDVIELKR